MKIPIYEMYLGHVFKVVEAREDIEMIFYQTLELKMEIICTACLLISKNFRTPSAYLPPPFINL